jgi:predicted secreted protein
LGEEEDGKSRSKREKTGEALEKVEAWVGKQFEIALGANPSTGYVWEPHFDSNRISLVSRRYRSEQKMVGGAGCEVFTFLALERGKTEIEMILKRRWEKGFLKKESFEIFVR